MRRHHEQGIESLNLRWPAWRRWSNVRVAAHLPVLARLRVGSWTKSVNGADPTGSMIEMAVGQQAPAIQRLQAAVAAEAAAQAAKAVAILDLAHEQEWYAGAEFEMVGRRPVRIGVDDAPLVDEVLPLEVAALTGTSVAVATALIRDIVNLHHRHEHAWRAVTDGRIPLWHGS